MTMMMEKKLNPAWRIVVVGLLLVALTLVATISAPVLALSHPCPCYGNVTLDGGPALVGTVIKIYIGQDDTPSRTFVVKTEGEYLTDVWADDDRHGEVLSYTVGGFLAPQQGVFGWEGQEVDLAVTSSPPPPRYDLTVVISPDGGGTVNESPTQPAEGYIENTVVTLTATAIGDYAFISWDEDASGTDNPTTVNMTSNMTVTAIFQTPTPTPTTTPTPTPDTTRPTLNSITWTDVDDSGTINESDTLRFNFSEAMNTGTITAANINARLPTIPSHAYGTLTAADLSWNTAKTQLKVTLGSDEEIVGGETVNPHDLVMDIEGNSDATTSPGPEIPTPTPTPTPVPPILSGIAWEDVDGSGTINKGDTLSFEFSEEMDTGTITVANIDTRLPTVPSHTYGILIDDDLSWSNDDKGLTVILGTDEAIISGETVNPSDDVTDKAGNADATTPPGPAIPTPPRFGGSGTVGTTAGTLTIGDFTMTYPAGAFTEDTEVTIASATCTGVPGAYKVGDSCFLITLDPATATLGAEVTVCVKYSDYDLAQANGDPGLLWLAYKDTAGDWQVLKTEVGTVAGTICADTDHLSVWGVFAEEESSAWAWWYTLLIVLGVLIVIAAIILLVVRPRGGSLEEFSEAELYGEEEEF